MAMQHSIIHYNVIAMYNNINHEKILGPTEKIIVLKTKTLMKL